MQKLSYLVKLAKVCPFVDVPLTAKFAGTSLLLFIYYSYNYSSSQAIILS
jgi:hypothetical protein